MSPEQLFNKALNAKNTDLILIFNRRSKRPAGFPEGKLLSEEPAGNVYSFNSKKVIDWLINKNLTSKECQ